MTVLVGHPPRPHDRSAISYGAMLARSLGTGLHVMTVVPAAWPTLLSGNVDKEFAAWSRAEGHRAVAGAETVLLEVAADLDHSAEAVSGRSVPATILRRARDIDARVVVLGSSGNGPWDRVVVGAIADHLLHASPIPVAVATRGFATHARSRFSRATCAFRGDRESERALHRTAEICAEVGADLRIATFGVEGRTMYPPEVRGEEDVLAAYVEQAEAAQQRALAGLPEAPACSTVVATGPTWGEAVGSLDWRDDEILVLGSSAGGVLARVFLGSNATRIVRHSRVPVVVVPG